MPTIKINDADIYYESHGNGFPLVFAYGLGGNTGMWANQKEAFNAAVLDFLLQVKM